jgi:predicted PurR-regulated permease PerM
VNQDGAAPPNRFGIPLVILVPACGALAALWFLRTALTPFFAAIVLAYLMQPLATRLSRRLRPGWAAVLAILVFALVLGLFLWALVPPFVAQVERLIGALPVWQQKAIDRWLPWFTAHPAVLAKMRQTLEGLDPMAFLQGLRIAGVGLVGWFLELMTLILVPLIAYYLLVEGSSLTGGMQELIPDRFREGAKAVAAEINNRLGGYIRGQLAVAMVMTLLQGTAFHYLGVPYAWVLGLLAGVANVVPYSCYVTALPLALLFSALDGAGWGHLLLVLVVFELVQKTEAFYFTPVWVGRATGLHPLEVLLAIFIFGFAFGIVGLIFAVPLMIIFKTLFRFLIANYKTNPWFTGEGQTRS